MPPALDAVLAAYPSWSHLVVRLALGVIFFAHGSQKVLGWFGGPGLSGTIKFMGGLGVPRAAAVTAAFIELLGGCAMIVGFLARPAAVGIIVIMLVAIAQVHGKNGFFLQGKTGPGYEFNFALIAMALSILIGGAGVLSIDRALSIALGGD
ncbi:MAG TPA: DoxX family protein [Methylomirabilota bacterium]|jgi:putative oxidoreductase|nr:DoxX family protein [Methylomirabilota bacterium]